MKDHTELVRKKIQILLNQMGREDKSSRVSEIWMAGLGGCLEGFILEIIREVQKED